MLQVTYSTCRLWLVSAEWNNQENISHKEDRWKCYSTIWFLQEFLSCLLKVLKAPFNKRRCIMGVEKWLKESKCTPICSFNNCSQSTLMGYYWKTISQTLLTLRLVDRRCYETNFGKCFSSNLRLLQTAHPQLHSLKHNKNILLREWQNPRGD